MDRSRSSSKRSYHYDTSHYFDLDPFARTSRPRFSDHHPSPRFHGGRGRYGGGRFGGYGGVKTMDMVTTSYRILCHDMRAGGVIGKCGNIIKAIRHHTGAKINVHELMDDDEERIIEISDTRRRDPHGRIPAFSPAQEALFLIHERIVECKDCGEGEGDYGGGGGGGNSSDRVVTRLVVSKMHVGSLLGKGGKIIEEMRIESKTHIRILPRDHTLPRCVSMGEEIVQVVGDVSAVKNAISIISSRLKESQHRDRGHFQGRNHSDDRYSQDDFVPHMNNSSPYGSHLSGCFKDRSRGYSSHENEPIARVERSKASFKALVFRLLCPNDRVESVTEESNGIIDLLQNDIGVNVKVSDPVDGSNECIITISSDEGPDNELFPAQEALLHIQTHIIDTILDKDNAVTTRLLVASRDIVCLNQDGLLSEMKTLTGADIEIVPRDKIPSFLSDTDELVQITGDLKAAREALMEVTARLRSHLYKQFFMKDFLPRSNSCSTSENGPHVMEGTNVGSPSDKSFPTEPRTAISQTLHTAIAVQPSKGAALPSGVMSKLNENEQREDTPPTLNSSRMAVPLVTRSILEVVIPEYAVTRLLAKSKNKLAQISELSGAKISLVEEDSPEVTEKIIRISGTPEQAHKARSLFQGFFLSIQEDGP